MKIQVAFWKRSKEVNAYLCWICNAGYKKEQAADYLWHLKEHEVKQHLATG